MATTKPKKAAPKAAPTAAKASAKTKAKTPVKQVKATAKQTVKTSKTASKTPVKVAAAKKPVKAPAKASAKVVVAKTPAKQTPAKASVKAVAPKKSTPPVAKSSAKPAAKATPVKAPASTSKTTKAPVKSATTTAKTTSKAAPNAANFKPYVAKKGEIYMGKEQLAHFADILTHLKDELMADIERTVHTMQDEQTVFADPNDRASQETDMALELRNRDRERKLIKKIEETLDRIKADDYGFCDKCGIEIGIQRLEARPTATLCIDCKTLEELREKQVAK